MSQRYLGGIITANPTAPTLASASGVWTLEQQFQYAQTMQPERIGNSLRLRASASAYLSRTPATASGYNQWTFSCWVKRGALGSTQYIIGGNTLTSGGTRNNLNVVFDGTDALQVYAFNNSSGYYFNRVSSALFRDPSAWYHLVVQFDPDNATSANKIIAYVNGQQVTWGTSADSGVAGSITSSAYRSINNTYRNDINGGYQGGGVPVYFGDGYLAECYMVSGMIVPVSSFGAFDSTGVWQPLAYTGTFGTNGFYLDFSDTSALTTASNVGLGKDYSGNGNYWVTNNISITSGATYDPMIDSPTNYADGGNGRGNYAVLNPLDAQPALSITNGNLATTYAAGAYTASGRGTVAVSSGKWYWETTLSTLGSGAVGVTGIDYTLAQVATNAAYNSATTYAFYNGGTTPYKLNSGTQTSYGSTVAAGDVIGVALDLDGGSITFYKNGSTMGSAFTGISGTFAPLDMAYSGAVHATNFGQRPFAYTPPTGFKALNTQNLPTATINNGAQYMAATLYSGNSGTQTVSNASNGVSFQPDLVWVKSRTNPAQGYYHFLQDSVRGISSGYYSTLNSNTTDAENAVTPPATYGGMTAITSSGFTVAGSGSNYFENLSGTPYVAWQWKANGSAVSNTAGSITSQVNAGVTQGFSVVTWTGNGTNGATVGHGLGVAPKMVIVKRRSAAENWGVYHASLPSAAYYLLLNTGAAQDGSGGSIWNSTAPSSTLLTLGTSTYSNASASTYVAYCFSEVAGYSKFGNYTGNGSTDGVFVYLGFRPRYLMVKAVSSVADWDAFDTSRDPYNATQQFLFPNLSSAEFTSPRIDLLSNGFKLRAVGDPNNSGVTYIYAAFAENPFTIARAR